MDNARKVHIDGAWVDPAAAEIVLSKDELGAIDQALPAGAAIGERYAPEGMRALNL